MFSRFSAAQLALASVAWLGACTTDFSGYHLAASSDDGGRGGRDTAGKGAATNGGDSANRGGTAGSDETTAGAGESGGNEAVGGGDGGASTTNGAAGSADGGSSTVAAPSCAGLAASCGDKQSASCCSTSLVPGGNYARSALAGDHTSVSSFMLDDYEVTVGRFRNFVNVFDRDMIAEGSGKNPSNAADTGWNSAWNARLPASPNAFAAAIGCTGGTFSSDPADDDFPVTCVDWYEANAFCIWDGGRLPTEAEWNYAAAAGSEERKYPWGDAAPDDTTAVFCPASCSTFQHVGMKPAGVGKWGQHDLVGNAWEWTLDVFANPYAQASCSDCANTNTATSSQRAFRGGSAGNDATYLPVADRYSRESADHNGFIGLRCARDR